MADKKKPSLTLARPVAKDLMELFRRLKGRELTPQEKADAEREFQAVEAELRKHL